MGKIYRGLELLLSLPKSFYVSWRLTTFKDAFKLPVICRYNCKVLNVSGEMRGGINCVWVSIERASMTRSPSDLL